MNETDTTELCRICLSYSSLCYNIYIGQSSDENPIYEAINYVYDLEISIGDDLPEYVCQECHGIIKKFGIYKRNAHRAKKELILLKQERQVFIKVEEEDYLASTDPQVTADGRHHEPQLMQKRKMDLCDSAKSSKTSSCTKSANRSSINNMEYRESERLENAKEPDIKQEPEEDCVLQVQQKEQSPLDVVSNASVNNRKRIRSCTMDEFSDEDETNALVTDAGDVTESSSSTSSSKKIILESKTLDVIARYLARLENKVDEIYDSQVGLLQRINPDNSRVLDAELTVPENLRIPFKSHYDIEELEKWLSLSKENEIILERKLSLLGGKRVANVTNRILESLFENSLALHCNWTGRNQKYSLKHLKLMKIIQGAVRRNKQTDSATDDEITGCISNWFRFTKDRDGGREMRRNK